MKFELHPLCALFPRMDGAEFEALKADIGANGLRQPIVTYQGSILDGGNRYEACMQLGVKPLMVEYQGDDIAAYVESANLHRRHLETASQRVAIAVALHEWVAANVGRPRVAPGSTLAKTNAQIAAQEKVSVRTVTDAKAAERAGLGQAVRDGAMTVKEAAKIARGGSETPKKEADKAAPPEDFGPDADELEAQAKAEAADAVWLQKLLDSDDKLAAAHAEIKRLNAVIATLEVVRDGYMNGRNEAIKMVKRLQTRLDKMERAAA